MADRLEDLLNAAGREVQPTVPGWDTLPARLASMPQLQPGQLRRWGTLPVGIGALAAAVLVAVWLMLPRHHAQAQDKPIEVRRESLDLTVLSVAWTEEETLYMPILGWTKAQDGGPRKKLTGQALVKDRRLVLNLKAGDNIVRFTEVAATIDPTSVRFQSLTDPKGTTVVEQSFEYDLATADALLKRHVDREVVCVDKKGQEVAGYLASFDDAAIVLAASPGNKDQTSQTVTRSSLAAVRLGDKPADLIVKPTLVWKLRTETPGEHKTLLTYICGYVKWHADYVVEMTPNDGVKPDLLDWNAWVTLENASGSTYSQVALRLIAGDVRRLKDPWSERAPRYTKQLGRVDIDDKALTYFAGDLALGEFSEQSFFEYHLYALNTPCTVGDHQIKQLTLLKKKGAQATRRYVFDPAADTRNLAIDLVVKNDKENQLGLPLPKGTVTLEQRGSDGEPVVLGRVAIDHTAVKEELKLRYGHALDIVGEHREVSTEKLANNARVTYEMRIRNHKNTAAAVRAYAVRLGKTGTLRQATLPHIVEDFQTLCFDFTLAANAEQVIRYTVVYRRDQ